MIAARCAIEDVSRANSRTPRGETAHVTHGSQDNWTSVSSALPAARSGRSQWRSTCHLVLDCVARRLARFDRSLRAAPSSRDLSRSPWRPLPLAAMHCVQATKSAGR